MKTIFAAAIAATAMVALAQPAAAVVIPDGTVTSSTLFNPTVNVSTNPSSYAAISGGTFQVSASGGFASAAGQTGTLNGTLSFSQSEGTTIAQTMSNFFVFSDGLGGTFNFSVASVRTDNFTNTAATTSGGLYALGTTVDLARGYNTPTPTSLTITFNRTGSSPYISSLSLAVPPAPTTVPEPASLALLGAGLVGAGLVRRRKTSV